MTFYSIVLLIHVLSAILGLGPGFVMIYVVSRAQTMTELKHAYLIRNRIHRFVMIGGTCNKEDIEMSYYAHRSRCGKSLSA